MNIKQYKALADEYYKNNINEKVYFSEDQMYYEHRSKSFTHSTVEINKVLIYELYISRFHEYELMNIIL
jgi:hypothetical protein